MSYATLPTHIREVAEEVLTRKQLDVFRLWSNGASATRISIMLDVSETRARYVIRRAAQKVHLEIERRKERDATAA